jgi:hypothetical protein
MIITNLSDKALWGLVGGVGSLNTPANSMIKTVISKGEHTVLG